MPIKSEEIYDLIFTDEVKEGLIEARDILVESGISEEEANKIIDSEITDALRN